MTLEREKDIREHLCFPISIGCRKCDLLAEIDLLREKLSASNKKLNEAADLIEQLQRKLEISGNAHGIAATFLLFHGKPSSNLDNCINMMKNHEKMALNRGDYDPGM